MTRPNLVIAFAFSVAAGTGVPTSPAAELYSADIDGPTAGTTSPATGTATLILNDAESEIAYEVAFSGLLGFETGAHFHNGGPEDSIAPRILTLNLGSPVVGVWEVGPFEIGELRAGRVFVMIHSDLYVAGEIRGNIAFSSVPVANSSWGAVKALFR